MKSLARLVFVLGVVQVCACVHYGPTSSSGASSVSATQPVPAGEAIPAAPPPPSASPPAYTGYRDAVEQLRKRCDGGQLGSCVGLGLVYLEGSLVPADRARASSLFQKACEGGDAVGCRELAKLGNPPIAVTVQASPGATVTTSEQVWVNGKLVSQSSSGPPTAAVETVRLGSLPGMFQKECDGGNQQGCVALGMEYWEGNFVAQDRAKGRQLLQAACNAGDKGGCTVLTALEREAAMPAPGTVAIVSDGSKAQAYVADTATATTLLKGVLDMLQTTCTAGNPQACASLGVFYWKGKFVPQDRAKARRFLKTSCDAGEKQGCVLLQALGASR
ncbi:MAG TPA: tetratricopeptide repeat protein [Myxococcales bacterium]|nr:tetratricopeptide repeat protein [Myxococcales bacterium]